MRKQSCSLENGICLRLEGTEGEIKVAHGGIQQSRSLQWFLKHPESVGLSDELELSDELGLCQVTRSHVGDNEMRRGRQTAGELPLHQAEIPLLMMCSKHLYLITPGKSYESPSGTQSLCPPGLGSQSPLI